ncbi:MAG: OsmC family peroxiredoxin [Deltaproteobacteria bacterium]|nr:OsmC family peroxiredoxin [Deltaproteobacteria bacterium]
MSDNQTINGFQCEELERVKTSLQTNPENGQFKLRAKNRWIDGAQSISLVSSFKGMGREFSARNAPFIQTTDTPEILAGKDLGPTPMEELLVALAASVTTTLAYRASVANLQVQEIECDVEGDVEFQDVMNSSEPANSSFKQIRVTVHVKSDASKEQLTALCAASPVLAALTRPVAVSIAVKKTDDGSATVGAGL